MTNLAQLLNTRAIVVLYVYRWDRQGRKGQPCAVTARGAMNSVRVQFQDGYRMITSGNAIRRNTTTGGTDE